MSFQDNLTDILNTLNNSLSSWDPTQSAPDTITSFPTRTKQLITQLAQFVELRESFRGKRDVVRLISGCLTKVVGGLKYEGMDLVFSSLLMLVRNMSAGVEDVQLMMWNEGVIKTLLDQLRLDTFPDLPYNSHSLLIQALANSMTGNERVIEHAFTLILSDSALNGVFKLVDKSEGDDDSLMMMFAIWVLNCVKGSRMRCKSLIQSISGKGLLTRMLQHIHSTHADEHESQSFTVMYALFSEFFEDDLLPLFMETFFDVTKDATITNTQLEALKLLDGYLHAESDSKQLRAKRLARNYEFQKHLQSVFVLLCKRILAIPLPGISIDIPPSLSISKSGALDMGLFDTQSLYLVLEIMNVVSQFTTSGDRESHWVGVLEPTVTLLHWAEKVLPRKTLKSMNNNNNANAGMSSAKIQEIIEERDKESELQTEEQMVVKAIEEGFRGLKGLVLQLLTNLTDECEKISLYLHQTLSCLPLILSQSQHDDNNPFIRERSILLIRNLCQVDEIREVLKTLEAKDVSEETKEMMREEAGIEAIVGQDGKVKFRKVEM